MARGAAVEAAIVERIRTSGVTLTVYYPAERPVVTGATPTTRPLNPLLGTLVEPEYLPSAGVASAPPVGPLPCLFYDTRVLSDTGDVRRYGIGTYVAGADVLVRVLTEDVLLGTTLSEGTVFDGCEYVECRGIRHRVIKVEPLAAGFRAMPVSVHVWLAGGQGQPV